MRVCIVTVCCAGLQLQVGEVVEGTVASLQPYGAFVTLGDDNVNGLLHISQISHDRISSVEQVLKIGQKVKVGARLPSAGGPFCYLVLPCVATLAGCQHVGAHLCTC